MSGLSFWGLVRIAGLSIAAVVAPSAPASALFAGESIVRVRMEGPIQRIVRSAPTSTPAFAGTLTLDGSEQALAIRISARGLSRRRRESCDFPPLRVEFLTPPAAGTLFEGQERLKLVTHCRSESSFQQHVLLEYAAYRLFNILTPRSFRVRLAQIEYADTERTARALSRVAFFIEDVDDVAQRNGLLEAGSVNIRHTQLSAPDTARFAIFQYMIGNVDWSAQTGPPGSGCCHNSKLLGPGSDSTTGLIAVPYDFDQSGIVDVPYAVVPPQLGLRSVRERRYRGYCIHNEEAQAAAAEATSLRAGLERAISEVPGMEPGTRRNALSYLARFFEDIETSARISARLLRDCRASGAD